MIIHLNSFLIKNKESEDFYVRTINKDCAD